MMIMKLFALHECESKKRDNNVISFSLDGRNLRTVHPVPKYNGSPRTFTRITYSMDFYDLSFLFLLLHSLCLSEICGSELKQSSNGHPLGTNMMAKSYLQSKFIRP